MRKIALTSFSAVFALLAFAPLVQAQGRRGFFKDPEAIARHQAGDEMGAVQAENLAMLRRNKNAGRNAGIRSRVDDMIYDGVDYGIYAGTAGMAGMNNPGCYSQARPIGQPMGKTKAAAIGGALGAAAGYGIGGGGRNAAIGGAAGAALGLLLGSRGERQYRQRQVAEADSIRAQELRMAEARQEAEARAQAQASASTEDKILRNRLGGRVHLYFKSGGRLSELWLEAGQSRLLSLPAGTQLVLAEVEGANGRMISLEYGSGKRNLPGSSGWEFFNPNSNPPQAGGE